MPPPKSQFALAGQAWEVTELDKKQLIIYVKKIPGISANMWTDTGNEYVHTKVMKKILEIIRSDEQYAFLDESAKKRLADIRTLCRSASKDGGYSGKELLDGSPAPNSEERMVLPISGTNYAVFPFLGTRGTMALQFALRERGFQANVYLSRYIPVCVEVQTDMGKDALISALNDICEKGADKYGFKIPENCEISGKYNDFIPRELLTKQYVEDYLDTDELKNIE